MIAFDDAISGTSVISNAAVFDRPAVISIETAQQLYWPPAKRPTASIAEAVVGEHLLDEIAALPNNWDGYGAPAMTKTTCATAKAAIPGLLQHVPLPEITPNSNDTISFEWEAARGIAHLEIGAEQFSFFLKGNSGPPVYLLESVQNLSSDGLGRLIHQRLFAIAVNSLLISDFRYDADVQFG